MGAARDSLRLARLLLESTQTLALAISLVAMSACVIPLAPEFQDPPAAQNYPPVIVQSSPSVAMTVVAQGMPPERAFKVSVRDLNLTDDLYVRWVADPYSANTRGLNTTNEPIPKPGGETVDVEITVSCGSSFLAPGIPEHTILAIVADRKFNTSSTVLSDLQDRAGYAVTAVWTLQLMCAGQAAQ
jgi:hypothetical protein